MSAFLSAIPSGLLDVVDLASLTLVSKEVCTIVHQSVKTIGGGGKILAVLDRFTGATGVRVVLNRRRQDIDAPWEVPNAVVDKPPNLKRIQSLSVKMQVKYDRKHAKKNAAAAAQIALVHDPLASVLVPGLAEAHLKKLEVEFVGPRVPILPSFLHMLASPSVSPSLVHLSVTATSLPVNAILATIWPVLEQGHASEHLETLSIRGRPRPSKDMGTACQDIMVLFRSLAARRVLPNLRELEVTGYLGRLEEDGSSPLRQAMVERLDLSHLTTCFIDDCDASTVLRLLKSIDDIWRAQLFACQLIDAHCSVRGRKWHRYWDGTFRTQAPGVMQALVERAPNHAIAGVVLTAMMTLMPSNLTIYPQGSYRPYKELSLAITAYILSCSSDSVPPDFLISWLAEERYIAPMVLGGLALSQGGNAAIASEILLRRCITLVRERPVTTISEATLPGDAMKVLLYYLSLMAPSKSLLDHYFFPRNVTTESIIQQACDISSLQLVGDLLRQYANLDKVLQEQLGATVVRVMGRSRRWSMEGLVEEVGAQQLCLFLIEQEGWWHEKFFFHMAMVEPLAEMITSVPRRYNEPINQFLEHLLGRDDDSQGYHNWKEALYDQLLSPHRWDSLWACLLDSGYDRYAFVITSLVKAARLRGLGTSPSDLLFPEEVKARVRSEVDIQRLYYDEEGGRALLEWLLPTFYTEPRHYFQRIIEGREKDENGIVQLTGSSLSEILIGWVLMVRLGGDWDAQVLAEEGNTRPALVHDLLTQTDFMDQLMGCFRLDDYSWSRWQSLRSLRLVLDALPSLIEASKEAFTEAALTKNRDDDSLLALLVMCYTKARQKDKDDIITLIKPVIMTLVQVSTRDMLVSLMVIAQRDEAGSTSIKDAVVEILSYLYNHPVSAEAIVRLMSRERATRKMNKEYIAAVDYVKGKLIARGGALAEALQ